MKTIKEDKKMNEKRLPETKIICDQCGYVKLVSWSSGGVICALNDETYDVYGHHNCPNGDMGTFRKAEGK